MSDEWAIAIFSAAVVMIIAIITGSIRATRAIEGLRGDLLRALAEHVEDDKHEFTLIRREIDDTARSLSETVNSMYQRFGDTITAIRQKVTEVELDAARLYIRREGYYKENDKLVASINNLRLEIKEDLLRMDKKLDTKT